MLPASAPKLKVRQLFASLAGALTLLFTFGASGQQSGPTVLEGVSEAAMSQITALLADKERRTKTQQKIDSQLLYGSRMASQREAAPGVPTQEVNLRYVDGPVGQLVVVDVRVNAFDANNSRTVKTINALGGKVLEDVPQFNAVHAALPLSQLEALAALDEVRFISPAAIRENDTGSVNSQGDVTMGADTARATYAPYVGGMKVCVISDSASATGIANSIANGNLTAGKVTVLPGQAGAGSDEGIAMMEIINDIAPGVQQFFATSGGSEASFAQNILSLYSNYKCDVMVDDIRFGGELPFQDAVIARAVNTVTAAGTIYFASAGNSGNKTDGTSGTWVGDFVNGGTFVVPSVATSYEVHSFQTSPTVQNHNVVNTGGSSYALSLFWADPEGASTNDYDLFQLNAAGTAVVSSSTNVQSGTQNAAEFASLVSNTSNRIVVVRKSGAASRALYLSTGRGRLSINTNGFARGHSAAINAIATAAVPASVANGAGPTGPFPGVYTSAQTTELFSSDGPARKFHHPDGSPVTPGNFLIGTGGGLTQQYPVITAPDGVSTSVPGFTTFFGTSAAAPHAAAVAALVKGRNPSLTAAQIRAVLTSTALDIEAAGVDSDTGSGIVRPVNALASITAAPGVAAGAVSAPITESFLPANGFVDPGETVTVNLPVINIGSAPFVNLVGTLQANAGVAPLAPNPQFYGALAASGGTLSLPFTFTAAGNCGDTITLTLQLQDGATNYGTVTYTITLGTSQTTTSLLENFDSVTAPALPAGWTSTVVSGAIANWATSTTTPDSGANAIFATPLNSVTDLNLDSPAYALPSGVANQLSFRHRWNTESGYDGGVLEISVNGGAYTDIITAGGSFVSGGYTSIIPSGSASPIIGRQAWTGASNASYTTTVINLPPSSAGQSVRFRFRLTSDDSALAAGTNVWRIDTIQRQVTTPVCVAATPTTVTLSAAGPVHRGQQSVVTATVSSTSGTPAGSVAISGAGATCNVTLAAGTGTCNLAPTFVGAAQTITGNYGGNGPHGPSSGTTTLTVKSTLDVDDNGASLSDSDGVIALRYMIGMSGAALTNNVTLGAGAQRTNATDINNYLVQVRPLLDIDGDNTVNPTTDGLLITRYLLGLRGNALIQGVVAPGAARTQAVDIEHYIGGLIQ
ncbi:MAG TPA: S8 family serine peptidase [Casimicrobium sp.]|nr:S8 family serine peptidase [Casimicrobium sp.]